MKDFSEVEIFLVRPSVNSFALTLLSGLWVSELYPLGWKHLVCFQGDRLAFFGTEIPFRPDGKALEQL